MRLHALGLRAPTLPFNTIRATLNGCRRHYQIYIIVWKLPKFVSKDTINKRIAIIRILPWRRISLDYWRIHASLDLNEFNCNVCLDEANINPINVNGLISNANNRYLWLCYWEQWCHLRLDDILTWHVPACKHRNFHNLINNMGPIVDRNECIINSWSCSRCISFQVFLEYI